MSIAHSELEQGGVDVKSVDKTALSVSMTDRASRRILSILSAEGIESGALRISVLGGGCSGFQYHFDIESGLGGSEDLVLEHCGAYILIDKLSYLYMEGSEIDYIESLIGSSFEIKNPNATASCGCGTSFSV